MSHRARHYSIYFTRIDADIATKYLPYVFMKINFVGTVSSQDTRVLILNIGYVELNYALSEILGSCIEPDMF